MTQARAKQGSPESRRVGGAGLDSAAPDVPIELTASALRRRYAPAFTPQPRIYWCDMLASAALGWTAFAIAARAGVGSLTGVAAAIAATLALYRAVLFIHELAHLKRGAVPGLETAWNLLVGFPLMVPSLMYVGSHAEHHRRGVFGTREDPEYERIAHWSPVRIVASTFTMVLVPGLLALRWGVFAPLSVLVPSLRELLVAHASTLVINAAYRRRPPRGSAVTRWIAQETGAALYFWLGVAGVLGGWIPLAWVALWYVVGVSILTLNHVRTLAAHRYVNDGQDLDAVGQLLDSVNLRGLPGLTVLIAPVGLRFHALHHLLPTLPYHSLGAVHHRLQAELPADSPYRDTEAPGVVATLSRLFDEARRRKNRGALPA
jgi:fatty acid desaturase